VTSVAIKGIGELVPTTLYGFMFLFSVLLTRLRLNRRLFITGADSDTVICTTDKKLATFFRGYLVKSCFVEIVVERLVPFVEYGPKIGVYYILYGDNRVVIVKDGTNSLEVCEHTKC